MMAVIVLRDLTWQLFKKKKKRSLIRLAVSLNNWPDLSALISTQQFLLTAVGYEVGIQMLN